MFGPLSFENVEDLETTCLLCDDKFNLKVCLPLFLKHIFESHALIIDNAQHIEDLQEYVRFWTDKFRETSIESVVPAVLIEQTSSKYFVLSDLIKDDKMLRHKIKLDHMLKVQEFERNDCEFKRACLFCKLNYQGKREGYLSHLLADHNIRIGNPKNLVFVDELLDYIEGKLGSLQCLYCEKVFVDRVTLKEHMRKKLHKRINPGNKYYDKFFAINYLNPDKKWYSENNSGSSNTDEEYDDWNEPDTTVVCLFCNIKETSINKLCVHMGSRHKFNFYMLASHLDFYQKVKLVNYIRRMVHDTTCFYCPAKFTNSTCLEQHINFEGHSLPDLKVFDQPEFFFPTFENDAFLFFLEDIED